jgi:hypothetical protein
VLPFVEACSKRRLLFFNLASIKRASCCCDKGKERLGPNKGAIEATVCTDAPWQVLNARQSSIRVVTHRREEGQIHIFVDDMHATNHGLLGLVAILDEAV